MRREGADRAAPPHVVGIDSERWFSANTEKPLTLPRFLLAKQNIAGANFVLKAAKVLQIHYHIC